MLPTRTRRYRRRPSSTREAGAFKKDAAQEQSFFSNTTQETFFQPASVVHRKCEKCEEDDKKVQRSADKKEDDKVMRMEDKKEEEKVMRKKETEEQEEEKHVHRAAENKEEDKQLQRQPAEEEEKVQKKEGSGTAVTSAPATSGYISTIHSKGQALPKEQQRFFGSRMGYDFSKVKVHTDPEAIRSAKDINAQAYTYGNHVVFNEGKYNPGTADGKRLMAHELMHVIQQSSPDTLPVYEHVQRAVNYNKPSYHTDDPIPKVLSAATSTLGKTHLKINGHIIYNKDQAMRALFGAFNDNLTLRYDPVSKSCKVNVQDINIDVSADMQILTNPVAGKWTGSYAGNIVNGCGNKPSVTIEMDAQPSGATAFGQRITADEKEHVDDFMQIAHRHIDAFYTYLSAINLPSKDGTDCAALFNTEIGTKDADIIKAFVADILSSIDAHDAPTGNHHHTTSTRPGNCNPVKITANF